MRTRRLLLACLASLSSAQAAEPDFTAHWREATCADDVILAGASARAQPACGSRDVLTSSVQYRPVSGGRGCEVWLAATCSPVVDTPYVGPGHATVPTIYTDESFGGTMLALGPGKLNLAEVPMREGGDTWNDKAGSIRVPEGWTLRLCSEPDGNGKCTDFTSEHPKLANTYVGNDATSSVEVVKGRLGPLLACPRVFEHDSFGGTYTDVCNDVSSWVGTPWNDRISSIQIPAGWRVQVCADVDYGGTCLELDADMRLLRDTPVGADRASSLRIVVRGG